MAGARAQVINIAQVPNSSRIAHEMLRLRRLRVGV
jgi:hypothetical protein